MTTRPVVIRLDAVAGLLGPEALAALRQRPGLVYVPPPACVVGSRLAGIVGLAEACRLADRHGDATLKVPHA